MGWCMSMPMPWPKEWMNIPLNSVESMSSLAAARTERGEQVVHPFRRRVNVVRERDIDPAVKYDVKTQAFRLSRHPDHRRIVGVAPLIVGMQFNPPEPRPDQFFQLAFGFGGMRVDRPETHHPSPAPVDLPGEPVD